MVDHLIWAAPLTGVIALVGFVFHNNNKNDTRVSGVYKRMDQRFKETTSKEICEIRHKSVDEKLDKIDKKIDKLLNGNA